MSSKLSWLAEQYEKVVVKYADSIPQIESVARTLLFLLPGRWRDSEVKTEAIYAAINLVSLFNYVIISKAKLGTNKGNIFNSKYSIFLLVLQYTEVLIEILAKQKTSSYTKWTIIFIIEYLKAIFKFMQLSKQQGPILVQQEIITNEPSKETDELTNKFNKKMADWKKPDTLSWDPKNGKWVGKRTGKVFRTLASLEENSTNNPEYINKIKQIQSKASLRRFIGETLHISRPVIYLLFLFGYGRKSWKPWIISLLIDLASRYLTGKVDNLNAEEKEEINRRNVLWLLYLIRSPFYEKYTRPPILKLCKIFESVPLLGGLFMNLTDLLAAFQSHYFYTSGS